MSSSGMGMARSLICPSDIFSALHPVAQPQRWPQGVGLERLSWHVTWPKYINNIFKTKIKTAKRNLSETPYPPNAFSISTQLQFVKTESVAKFSKIPRQTKLMK